MFEFKKLCKEYEQLSLVERGFILTDKSVKILAKLKILDVQGVEPVSALAGFIIGSVVADGKIDEQEYLLIYPALIKVFGYNFDFYSVKQSFCGGNAKKLINEYIRQMIRVIDLLDDDLKCDVITLCLCVTAIDGKISLREKRYIKRLCKA